MVCISICCKLSSIFLPFSLIYQSFVTLCQFSLIQFSYGQFTLQYPHVLTYVIHKDTVTGLTKKKENNGISLFYGIGLMCSFEKTQTIYSCKKYLCLPSSNLNFFQDPHISIISRHQQQKILVSGSSSDHIAFHFHF